MDDQGTLKSELVENQITGPDKNDEQPKESELHNELHSELNSELHSELHSEETDVLEDIPSSNDFDDDCSSTTPEEGSETTSTDGASSSTGTMDTTSLTGTHATNNPNETITTIYPTETDTTNPTETVTTLNPTERDTTINPTEIETAIDTNKKETTINTNEEETTINTNENDFMIHSTESTCKLVNNEKSEEEQKNAIQTETTAHDLQNDTLNDSEDQITDLSSSKPPEFRSTAPPESVTYRLRTESCLSCSSDEFSDRPISWASSESDRYSYQSSILPGSSMRSSTSYAPSISDHSDVELEPEVDTHKPHRNRTTIRRKEEPQDIQEKRKKKAFNIVNEIRTTEETFVKVLKLLNEGYRHAILRAGNALGRPLVPNEVMENIFRHLPELQNLNEELLKDFTIRIKGWEENPTIADVFIKKGPFLKLYTSYISQFESLTSALDDARNKYPDFDVLTKAFEMSPKCQSLALKHYMLKPVQRIPQYKLLLQDYMKQLMEDSEEYTKTKEALAIVSDVATHANENMKLSDETKKLWDIQHNLIGHFEVIKPGRKLIKAGLLKKMSRKFIQHRMFFLFSDVMLHTTPVATGYKLSNVFPLTSLKVIRSDAEGFQNEFTLMSTERSIILSTSTPEERDDWLDKIQHAIEDEMDKRQSFDTSTSRSPRKKTPPVIIDSSRRKSTAFKIGTQAPVWIPDDRVTMCMLCAEEFTITFRRHHCRACGKIVCSYCSDNKAPMKYLCYKQGRVCAKCFTLLLNEAKSRPDSVLEAFEEGGESMSRAALLGRFKGFNWASFRPQKLKRPTVLHEVKANDEDAAMSGYLKMWKGNKWKRRWFVLKNNALYTFKAPEDAAAIESVAVTGLVLKTFNSPTRLAHVGQDGLDPHLVIELVHQGTRPLTYMAESPLSKDKWMAALKQATKP